MHRQLLLLLLSLYGVDWTQTINDALLATDTTHFTLGLAVMRLLVHSALLLTGTNNRWLRGYNFWGIAICMAYLYATYYAKNEYLNGEIAGFISGSLPQVGIRGIFVIESLVAPFLMAIRLRQVYRDRLVAELAAENKELETKQLQALDQLKNRFFTTISHEFHTPLTLLLGPLDDLRQRFPTNTTYGIMHRNAKRLHTLINQLLDLAKLDAHQLKPNPQPGIVTDDVQTWVSSFESMAQNRGIDLTLDQSEPDWQAVYDAEKMEKIASNLIANALKFTNRGGKVEVATVYETAGLTLRVSDTGVGIPPENLPVIFDRFYQGEPAKKSNAVEAMYEGAGVGLALVRELIDLLEGSIGVASLVGEGTTFTVWVPMQGHPLDPTAKIAERPVGMNTSESKEPFPTDSAARPPH